MLNSEYKVYTYRMCGSHPSEVGHIGNGTHWESFVNQSIVDKHVSHPKHRDSKSLPQETACYYTNIPGHFRNLPVTDPD